MAKKHIVNAAKGILNFSYIPFDRAYKLAENFVKKGGSLTRPELSELIGRNKTGWLGLEIKSMRVWGLISGKGKMSLTKRFHKISSSKDPNEKLKIKRKAFMSIPLFKQVFQKYSNSKLPEKLELSRILELEYRINPTYSSNVSETIIDSIQKYFRDYGNKYVSPTIEIAPKKEVEDLGQFLKKKDSINIKITSPIGNFNLEATNKEEFEKIIKIINFLWDERSDTDENQEEGAHEI